MAEHYSDALNTHEDNTKDQNNQEIKPPFYKNLLLNFLKGGIVALIIFSIPLLLLILINILFYDSSSVFSFLLIYGYASLLIFAYLTATSSGLQFSSPKLGTGTGMRPLFTKGNNPTHQKSKFGGLPRTSRFLFSFWMMIYGAIMVMIAEGVISF